MDILRQEIDYFIKNTKKIFLFWWIGISATGILQDLMDKDLDFLTALLWIVLGIPIGLAAALLLGTLIKSVYWYFNEILKDAPLTKDELMIKTVFSIMLFVICATLIFLFIYLTSNFGTQMTENVEKISLKDFRFLVISFPRFLRVLMSYHMITAWVRLEFAFTRFTDIILIIIFFVTNLVPMSIMLYYLNIYDTLILNILAFIIELIIAVLCYLQFTKLLMRNQMLTK